MMRHILIIALLALLADCTAACPAPPHPATIIYGAPSPAPTSAIAGRRAQAKHQENMDDARRSTQSARTILEHLGQMPVKTAPPAREPQCYGC